MKAPFLMRTYSPGQSERAVLATKVGPGLLAARPLQGRRQLRRPGLPGARRSGCEADHGMAAALSAAPVARGCHRCLAEADPAVVGRHPCVGEHPEPVV